MKRQSPALVVVNTTVSTRADAHKLANAILKSRLAACAQFTPIHSVYRWKGKLESTPEYLMLAKTRAALAADLTAFIKRHHPYEVPEILVMPITAAYGPYRAWIEAETKTVVRNAGKTWKRG